MAVATDKKRIAVTISRAEYEAWNKIAKKEGRSISNLAAFWLRLFAQHVLNNPAPK